jgi:peptidoglycan/LPS O-acetylase OafA/YrhL
MTSDKVVRTPRLDSLTALRFFAALAVVALHSAPVLAHIHLLSAATWAGPAGVDFFFVLSGFVLTWSHNASKNTGTFYWNRFARVWPLHALTWLVMIGVLHELGSPVPIVPAIVTLFLLQAWVNNDSYYEAVNTPSWSLSCEALFYACFPLLVRRVRPLSTRAVALTGVGAYVLIIVAAVAARTQLHGRGAAWAVYDLPVYRLLEFVIGIALAVLVERGVRIPVPRPAAAAFAVASFLAIDALHYKGVLPSTPAAPTLLILPSVVLVLLVYAAGDADGRRTVMQSRPLVRLGEWSFALYLIHWPALTFLSHHLGRPSRVEGLAIEVAFLAVMIALSGVVYHFFERPVERWLRARGPRQGAHSHTAIAKRSQFAITD